MSEASTKRGFIANIPGCCDPEKPFRPIYPNECKTCAKHADYTCWDWFPEGPKGKLKFENLKRGQNNEKR
jgi:hypothetical protein